MQAIVINLDSAKERLDFQMKQLDSLGIKFQRLAAYQINSDSDNVYQNFYKTWQRPMTVSEVSCFFSHKNAWDIILEKNEPMLILEDDAWLAENVPEVLGKIESSSNIDYITLEVTGSNSRKLIAKTPIDSFCNINLLRLYQGRSGAGGYVLWPSGAKKLLDQFNQGRIGLADKFINANYSLLAYQVEPAIVIQLDQCRFFEIEPPLKVNTSISNKNNTSLKPYDRVRYKLKRALGEIKIGLNLLKHKQHAVRRRISLSDYFRNNTS